MVITSTLFFLVVLFFSTVMLPLAPLFCYCYLSLEYPCPLRRRRWWPRVPAVLLRACRLVTDNRVLNATALVMLWWPVPEGHVPQPPSGGELVRQPQRLVDVQDEDGVKLAHLLIGSAAAFCFC